MSKDQNAQQPVSISGCLDGILGIFAVGWVAGELTGRDKLDLVIAIDGQIAAEGSVSGNGERSDFRIPLPSRYFSGKSHSVEAYAVIGENSYLPLGGGAQFLGDDQIDSFFDMIADGAAKGWCRARSMTAEPSVIELYVDGILCGSAKADIPRNDLEALGIHIGRSSFSFPLPDICGDGRPHIVDVQCNGTSLAGSPRIHQAFYEGFVDTLDSRVISGWVLNRAALSQPVKLIVKVGDQTFNVLANEERKDLAPLGSIKHGFYLRFPASLEERDLVDVSISVEGTDLQLMERPVVLHNERGLQSLKAHISCALSAAVRTSPAAHLAEPAILSTLLKNLPDLLAPSTKAFPISARYNERSKTIVAAVIDGDESRGIDIETFINSVSELPKAQLSWVVLVTGGSSNKLDHLCSRVEETGGICIDEKSFIERYLQGQSDNQTNILIVPWRCIPPVGAILVWIQQLTNNPIVASVSPVNWLGAVKDDLVHLNLDSPNLAFLTRPRTDAVLVRRDEPQVFEDGTVNLSTYLERWAERQTAK